MIDPTDERTLAYVAGLFDGEGSAYISRRKDGKTGYISHVLIISLGMTHKPTIDFLCDLFGGSIRIQKDTRDSQRKDMFRWFLCGEEAALFLTMIHTYLITKKEQAKLGIQYYYKIGRRQRGGVSSDVIEERHRYYLRMIFLNKRKQLSVEELRIINEDSTKNVQ